ncbi:hypothetical protein F7725_003745 [Dissostichus mawsoni]|uniref:Uncharacterized protein n=1 Tax=Dissostichus mawsoni TaxID=36200 RepID=A0A7J5YDQ5_DISMA|nr:hypothetical protein F7725_003745 [Dissostichus mawsoni]
MKLVASTSKEIVEGESTFKENIEKLPGESKSKDELMELLNWRMMEEQEQEQDTRMSNSQSSKYKSHHDRLNTMVDDDSSCEDHQAMKTVLKTLEELSQDIAGNQEDELVLTQVCPSLQMEKEDSEEYQLGKGAIKVQNYAPAIYLPSPSVSVTTETSVEIDRRTEKDQTPILSSSQRSTLLDSSFKEHPNFYNNHPEKGGRELEEMERPNSNSTSSSASQENGRDDARKEMKKQKKHKKEKREASPELCEEEELKKQKKKTSKQSRDGRRRRLAETWTKLCLCCLYCHKRKI